MSSVIDTRRIQSRKPKAVRLTRRELQVLCLISEGLSSKEAADKLFVVKSTVDFHLGNIYDKLMVNNRVHAIRVAVRLGLIPFDPGFTFVLTN